MIDYTSVCRTEQTGSVYRDVVVWPTIVRVNEYGVVLKNYNAWVFLPSRPPENPSRKRESERARLANDGRRWMMLQETRYVWF